MKADMVLRVFKAGDAEAVCQVLHDSIAYTFKQDYPTCSAQSLQDWLTNKTPENITEWVSHPSQGNVLALIEDNVVGVGMVNIETGHLGLCYVQPEFMGHGIGYAILLCLEEFAVQSHCSKIHFTATLGAQAFYERWGAKVTGEEVGMSGETMNPLMEKQLQALK